MPLRTHAGALVQTIAAGALAGAVAGGLAGGVGGRLAMRVTALMATEAEQGTITEAGETVGRITVGGTIALVIFGGVLFGVLGGFIYAATSRWFADAGPWRGMAFGAFLLGTLGWGIVEGDNFDFATLGSVVVNLAMFAAIFILFGVLIAPLYAAIKGALMPLSLSVRGAVVLPFYAVGLLLALGVAAITASAFGEDGREAPLYAIIPIYLVGSAAVAGAIIGRDGHRFEKLSDLRGDSRTLAAALAVIAVPLLAGIALDAQALVEILGDAH